MSAWLEPVTGVLEQLAAEGRTVRAFVRDDDGGWDPPALDRLLDVAARHPFVVDVAVIPELAARASGLRRWIAAGVARVHQHGWAHVDHGTEVRKCEFGAGRSTGDVVHDLARGKAAMVAVFGHDAQPIFTPPWNRCSPATAHELLAAGIEVLSRDASAEPFGLAGLSEVPVSFDWSAKVSGAPIDAAERGRRLAAVLERNASTGEAVGIMLHHAVLDGEQLTEIDALLALLAGSPAVVASTIAGEARRSGGGVAAPAAQRQVGSFGGS